MTADAPQGAAPMLLEMVRPLPKALRVRPMTRASNLLDMGSKVFCLTEAFLAERARLCKLSSFHFSFYKVDSLG